MTDTLIKVDLTKSPLENENIHNRWHPDIPMAVWVRLSMRPSIVEGERRRAIYLCSAASKACLRSTPQRYPPMPPSPRITR